VGHAFRIGRLFGIELRVDPSWLFIFVLVGWSLTSLFASWHPDWALATSLVVALTAALVFFASVLFHELAHCLVARAYGIPVRDITLHLFGGVSNIEKEPPTPAAEFLMAVVGPIASVGLGLLMIMIGAIIIDLRAPDVESAAAAVSRLGPVTTLLVWLGPVNVMVGIFNLIPGFPLDGGRMLRAAIWKATGSLQRSTRAASAVGQALGWLFVALGVVMALGYRVPFFGQGLTSGLWLAMIGLFLRNAAVAHVRGAAIEEALLGVRTMDLMRTTGPVVHADMRVRDLVEGWFMRFDVSAYPVLDRDGAFVGLVSLEDLRKIRTEEWSRRTIGEVMTPRDRLVVGSPVEDLTSALRKLGTTEVRQLPVLDDNGVLVGMLYERDVMRWLELHGPSAPRGTRMHERHA
jgi:Zn-dependent protease/predicted transcriptional regulator